MTGCTGWASERGPCGALDCPDCYPSTTVATEMLLQQREINRLHGILLNALRGLKVMDPLVEIIPGLQARDIFAALDWVTDQLENLP